ncbi:MAG: ERF family protein [Halanaerobiales bacterium]
MNKQNALVNRNNIANIDEEKLKRSKAPEISIVERVGTKEELAQLYLKLAKTTAEIETVEKNGYNNYHNYEYATADDIYKVVSSVLAKKHNIALLTMPVKKDINVIKTQKGTYREVDLEKYFSFNDGDSGAYIGLIYHGYNIDSGDKFLYKAYTGALKYFLRDNFLIDTGDPDPEMDNEVVDSANSNTAPVKKTKKDKGNSNKKSTRVDRSKSNTKPKKNEHQNQNLINIKEAWRQHAEIVQGVAYKFLKENGKEEDLSQLTEFSSDELQSVVDEINKKVEEGNEETSE